VLAERYAKAARAVALNVCRDGHAASDICQDALLKAYRGLATLRKPARFGPWLMQITRRCALDHIKRQSKTRSCQRETADQLPGRNGQLDKDNAELLAAVMRLAESERQVVMLRYFGEKSVRDVAQILDRSVGTVTKQLSRAHKRLKRILMEA
jgi:RNA polymerase sigma-70 factor (ECF subfamily)